EIAEVEEPFPEGSSSMPHKRNPIVCERICGLARILRGYLQAHLESIALWHERDMSHSSVERIALPDGFLLAFYVIEKLREVVDGLVFHEDAIAANLRDAGDAIYSEAFLHALIDAGMSRSEAHEAIRAATVDAGASVAERLATVCPQLPQGGVDLHAYRSRLRARSRETLAAAKEAWDAA
ncbi:MAG: hypothetical protein JSW65_03470, partial [Candidatus Bipolaricaulota bacterium]